MQQISAALQAALIDIDARVTPRVLVDLFEFYEPDYVPSATGFDPDDAIESFAAESLTWNGNAYRREVISRGDIVRNMGEKTNSVTLTFSNLSRYAATWAQTSQIEGLFCVIRCVVPSVTDDSIVLFVGRADKPSDIDKSTFTLTARQDFGNINQELPPRIFEAEDPQGRVPSDPLYEGFRIQPLSGSFSIPVTTASTSFFGRLFGRKKTVNEARQWSSLDETPYGSVVPMVFGRCQMELIPIMFADIGYSLIGVWVVAEGRVDTFSNVTVRDEALILVTERDAYGDPGGTGTNQYAVNPSAYPQGAIAHGYLSKTAYTVLSIKGSAGDVVDEAPTITALVRGTRLPVPDSSGDWSSEAWSNNPVDVARFILTDSRMVRIDEGFMEDAVNYRTHQHCDEALIDDSNGEVSLIPAADLPQAGTNIHRYPSTGILNTHWYLYHKLGDTAIIPELEDNDYTGVDLFNIPTTFGITRLLRKRYTFNAPITEKVRAVDVLYKKVFPTAKLFLRINKKGKYELRSEVAADATMIRAATAVGATAIPVLDATFYRYTTSITQANISAMVANWYVWALPPGASGGTIAADTATLMAALATSVAALRTAAGTMLKAIFLSAPYVARSRTDAQFVSDVYHAYMRRAGDAGGLAFWTTATTGTSRTATLNAFNGSSEFLARVNDTVGDLAGRILLGFGLTTSEVRNVIGVDYSTSGNDVTLAATAAGGVTATESGASLSGGSTTTQASATVTIGGTPTAGDEVEIDIDGWAVNYTLNADDTTGTVAAILAAYLNATPKLRRYISAEWLASDPTIITIRCKHGVLNLDAALLQPHSGPIIDPAVVPSLSDSAGALAAGTYLVAYADVNSLGQTALSPTSSITIGANRKIDIGALALVGTSRNWYMSDAAGSPYLKYVANTNGSAFSINALPLPGAAIPRGYNTTGEELIRIAMSFATNSQDIYPAWSPSTTVLLNDIYLPTVPNGHRYRVTTAGVTDTSEPVWPVALPITPISVAGCKLWLTADSLTLNDDDPVATWSDSSGNGNNATQGTGANQPLFKTNILNGKPSLLFDGSNDFMSAPCVVSGSGLTIFVVAKRVSSIADASTITLYDSAAADDYNNVESAVAAYEGGGTILQSYRSGGKSFATHPGNAVPYIFSSVFDGANNTVYLNGAGSTPVASSGTFSIDVALLASRRVGGNPSTRAHTHIFEVVIFDSALSAGDRQIVEDYLGDKYSIAVASPLPGANQVTNGTAVFTEDGATYLGQAGLTRANVKKDSFKWPLNRQSSVNQIKGQYRDANNDFALTPFKVNDRIHQGQVNKIYPLEVDLSGVDNFHQTRRLANWLLAKNREGDWYDSLATGPQGLILEEGDVICASDDSGGLVNVVTRIEELRIHANHDVTIAQARKYSTNMFLDEVGADTIPVPTTLRYTQTVDSIAFFIDSYAIRDADALVVGFYISVSRDLATEGDWRGWALYADYGDGYLQIAQGDVPAIMGVADTTLASVADPSVFDRVNELDFTLQYGAFPGFNPSFTSVTETELLANPRRNLFRIGNEYVQAATIVDNGSQSFTLSKLLRGRFGTNTSELTHSASEQVVYLDGSEVLVAIDPVRLNQEYNYKVVTTNQDVADATAIPFTWTGGTAKTPPPSSLRGERDNNGNLLILWNRASRVGIGMSSGTDVPLGEEQEKYIVETYDGSTLKRAMTAIVGMSLPAIMLGLDGTPAGTSKNSIALTGPSFTGHTAQIVPITGNFFEAEMGAGVSPSFELSQFGFIAPNANWADPANSNAAFHLLVVYSKANLGGGSFLSTFQIYQRGILAETINYTGSGYLVAPRIRVLLQSGEFRVYLNWAGASSVPIYVSAIRPEPPYTVGVHCSGTSFAYLRSAIMTIAPQPATVYSVAQETEDGLTPPVKVRVYGISAVVGKGGYSEAEL